MSGLDTVEVSVDSEMYSDVSRRTSRPRGNAYAERVSPMQSITGLAAN